MTANPILLQKKDARLVASCAHKAGISLDGALRAFYHSATYELMRDGVSDMHCRSDEYLADELLIELKEGKLQ